MQILIRFLTSSWFLCPLLTLLLLAASLADYPALRQLDLPIYDHLIQLRSTVSAPQVVLITCDQQSRAELGEISGHRASLALMLRKLRQLGTKQLALLTPLSFSGNQNTELSQFYPALGTRAVNNGMNPAEPEWDEDQALLTELVKIRPVLALEESRPANMSSSTLPGYALLPSRPNMPPPLTLLTTLQNPLAGYRQRRLELKSFLPPAIDFQPPQLALGQLRFPQDADGKIRSQLLLQPTAAGLVPSLPLQTVLASRGLSLSSLQLPASPETEVLQVGSWQIPVSPDFRLQLNLSGQGLPFSRFNISQLLKGELDSKLADKIVLLETTATLGDYHLLANNGEASTAELAALATATLLTDLPLHRPGRSWLAESLVLIYFSLLLLLLVPRLSFRAGLTCLAAFLGLWLLAAAYGLIQLGVWLQVAPAIILCPTGFLLVRWKQNQRERQLSQVDTNRLLALSFQEQGLLDLALDKALHLPPKNKATREMLYNLGLDFERKRMPHKALTAYRHLLQGGRFRDVRERLKRLNAHGQDLAPASRPATRLLDQPGEKPTLGRYQIEKELGQGAMGTVYLGTDPKINRQVAIKTLDYQQIDPDQLPDIKKRFFSEAEAAGRLNHPQIITIYDVGEEKDLAYLAMELLTGQELSNFCQAGKLLPLPRALDALSQVARALNYAHKQGVIHRDIKPANILITATGQVKVVDFGIAQVASRTQTETGIILGTPSYMSPEQLSGKKIDGRSDLFSLGVVMYELLSGGKPFTGENLAALMYNISRCDYRPLTEVRPKLPGTCQEIVGKLLRKGPAQRYKTAALLAAELTALHLQLEKK